MMMEDDEPKVSRSLPERAMPSRHGTWMAASSGHIPVLETTAPRTGRLLRLDDHDDDDDLADKNGGYGVNRLFKSLDTLPPIASPVEGYDRLVEWEQVRHHSVLKGMDRMEFRTQHVLRCCVQDALPELILVRSYMECLVEAQEQLLSRLVRQDNDESEGFKERGGLQENDIQETKEIQPSALQEEKEDGLVELLSPNYSFSTIRALEETDRVMERQMSKSLQMIQKLVQRLADMEDTVASRSQEMKERTKSTIASMELYQRAIAQAWKKYQTAVDINKKQQQQPAPFFSKKNGSSRKLQKKPQDDVWLAECQYRSLVHRQSRVWQEAAVRLEELCRQLMEVEQTRREQLREWIADFVERQQFLSHSLEMATAVGQMFLLVGLQQEHLPHQYTDEEKAATTTNDNSINNGKEQQREVSKKNEAASMPSLEQIMTHLGMRGPVASEKEAEEANCEQKEEFAMTTSNNSSSFLVTPLLVSPMPKLILNRVADPIPLTEGIVACGSSTSTSVFDSGVVQFVTLLERWAVSVDASDEAVATGAVMLSDEPIVSLAVLSLAGLLHIFDFTQEQLASLSFAQSTVAEAWETLVASDLELFGTLVEPSLSLPLHEYRLSIVDQEHHIVELRRAAIAVVAEQEASSWRDDETGTTDQDDDYADEDVRDRVRLPSKEAMEAFVNCFDFDGTVDRTFEASQLAELETPAPLCFFGMCKLGLCPSGPFSV